MPGNESLSYKELKESIKESHKTKTPKIILQPRDYEILKYILEQKFCSLEAIYFRFFDLRANESDSLPKNLWTVRQRLLKLRSCALIKTEKVLSSGKAHFLLTPLGFKAIGDYFDETIVIKPTKKIDFSLYEHDVRVLMIRSFLEKRGKAKKWFSEKWLRNNTLYIGEHGHRFSKDLRPDAVFVNSRGERVALEFEMSRKGIRRLKKKYGFMRGF